MVKLAVFLENWPCKTRLHGSLAKPLFQENIAPRPAFFSADARDYRSKARGATLI